MTTPKYEWTRVIATGRSSAIISQLTISIMHFGGNFNLVSKKAGIAVVLNFLFSVIVLSPYATTYNNKMQN